MSEPTARFRRLGQRLLQEPQKPDWHALRMAVACRLDGSEPIQGALADALHVQLHDNALPMAVLACIGRLGLLPGSTVRSCARRLQSKEKLPRINALSTRWSVLTSPSLDVPVHRLLCSPDDAQAIAATTLMAMGTGEQAIETVFLDHCATTCDVQSFMLVRHALKKRGHVLSPAWTEVARALVEAVNRSES